jgi:CRP-like cAMP-binding protein
MEQEYLMSKLSNTVIFKGIDDDKLTSLMQSINPITKYYKQEQVINNFPQKSIGIVLNGVIDVKRYLNDGNIFLLKRIMPSELFGVSSIFSDNPPIINTLFCQSDSKVVYFSEKDMMSLFNNENRVLENYLNQLNSKISYLNRKIDLFTCNNSANRLMSFLTELYHFQRSRDYVMLYYTKTELAEMLLMGRTTLYRAFEHLEKNNFIKIEGNKIMLL